MKRWGCLLLPWALLSGCAGTNVKTYSDPALSFAEYRTFDWASAPAEQPGQLDPATEERLKAAAEQALTARGLSKQTENPDLLLSYHLGRHQKVEVDKYGEGAPGEGVDPRPYEEGTLTMDLVNVKTQLLAWRGSFKKALPDQPLTGDDQAAAFARVMEAIFAKYPPGR